MTIAAMDLAIPQTLVSHDEVSKHKSEDDCWVILHAKVYDVTSFVREHPGGSAVIMRYAGGDLTESFDEVHAPSIVTKALRVEQCLGLIDPTSTPVAAEKVIQKTQAVLDSAKPPLHSLISVHDFEDVARQVFTAKAFAFFSSAATDLISYRANMQSHRQLLLRPRVLRNVQNVSLKRNILGIDSNAPFFVSPAAMARLAHPDGELAIARACGEQGIIQTISSNASYPLAEVVAAGKPDQPFFFQLYVNSDRAKTEDLLRSARALGVKALQVTVDAPIPGKREADERIAAENLVSAVSGAVAENDKKGGGLGRVMAKYIDSTLSWEDLAWLKDVSGLPIVLKGIQTAADAQKAVEYGAAAILLSNHGGRSLDTTQPAMLTLLELHKHAPEVFEHLEVYVDGGFTRGTDVIKALALGATAVGLGRPFLYALAYGQDGVEHLIEVLTDEIESTMKLAGITDVDQAHPGMVNTAMLEPLIRGEAHPWIQWKPKANL